MRALHGDFFIGPRHGYVYDTGINFYSIDKLLEMGERRELLMPKVCVQDRHG